LKRIGWGAEASAWRDPETECVYKLFEVHPNSALGKKLFIERHGDGEYRAIHSNASLDDTLEKLALPHEAGACPTEIVGLTETGDYLIAKQPLCAPFADFEEDRRRACDLIRAVTPRYSLGREIHIFWVAGEA